MESIIVKGPEGIGIIPASSGIQELTEMKSVQQAQLIRELSAVVGRYDYLLIVVFGLQALLGVVYVARLAVVGVYL